MQALKGEGDLLSREVTLEYIEAIEMKKNQLIASKMIMMKLGKMPKTDLVKIRQICQIQALDIWKKESGPQQPVQVPEQEQTAAADASVRECVTVSPANRITFVPATNYVPLVIKNNSSDKNIAFKIQVNQNILHPIRPNIGLVEAGKSQTINMLYCPQKTLLNVEDSSYNILVAFTDLPVAQAASVKGFWENSQATDQHSIDIPVSASTEKSIEEVDIKLAFKEHALETSAEYKAIAQKAQLELQKRLQIAQ